jgi:hypothetical protein
MRWNLFSQSLTRTIMGRSRLRVCNYSAKKMITNLSDLKLVMKEVDETLSDADITGK